MAKRRRKGTGPRRGRAGVPTESLGDVVLPPSERGQHDTIRPTDERRRTRPYFVLGMLAGLEEQGKITREQRLAGDEFHRSFRRAHLDDLAASDLGKPHVSGRLYARDEISVSAEAARARIISAIKKLGGFNNVYSSCAYEVIGAEKSLRQWVEEKGYRKRNGWATTILIATVAMLAARERRYTGLAEPPPDFTDNSYKVEGDRRNMLTYRDN